VRGREIVVIIIFCRMQKGWVDDSSLRGWWWEAVSRITVLGCRLDAISSIIRTASLLGGDPSQEVGMDDLLALRGSVKPNSYKNN
jgi:hypothetical protein